MADLARRGFLRTLGIGLLAAPIIVRATSIMPVRAFPVPAPAWDGYDAINFEDLANVIYNISPAQTPFMRRIAAYG